MKENNPSSRKTSLLVALAISLVVALVILSSTKQKENTLQSKRTTALPTSIIEEGNVGGIPYLHCSASPSPQTIDVVLLHGAAFTKENWKTSGILEKLCQISHFSITALDLDKSASHVELKAVLDAMTQESMTNLPVGGIVTPSASGKTIVDWLQHDNIPELNQYIAKWIPVAPPAVKRATDKQLQELSDVLPILAIYGNKDEGGKVVSETLGKLSQAKVVEIPGSHPCYLDSPDDFIQNVRDFLEEQT